MNKPASTPHCARPRPCPSCPYRRGVPSGIWSPREYAKLIAWDADMSEQPPTWFACHSEPEMICAGWLGHREHPTDLLGVRIGLTGGWIDPAVLDYTTDVPLFASGAEAAAHGLAEVKAPSEAAITAGVKILAARRAREDG